MDGFSIWPENWCEKDNNFCYRTVSMGFQLEKIVSWTFDKMPVLPHYWCIVFCTCMSGQM